ncbi:TFP11-domain-containing protein [Jaminaea rosea]|uniref:TFP11-domain-containing protein n=1 Tax=Jaminaea rosea TaxID=1569628 RepID=A0A316UX86_9BASI|nr:TFP11-domain-containing protein [Jaminaea rosea]PWN29916.1 TFP11-domain-containing protein [Jaminaea rosea]
MGKRSGKARRAIEDDEFSSSDDSSSSREASTSKLGGKRGRRTMHDEANLGAFGDDDDHERRGSRRATSSRSLLKRQAFVPASSSKPIAEENERQGESSASESDGEDALMKEAQQTRGEDELDDDAAFKPASFFSSRAQRDRMDEDADDEDASAARPGIGGRGGIGSSSSTASTSRGGIGSRAPPMFAPASSSSSTPSFAPAVSSYSSAPSFQPPSIPTQAPSFTPSTLQDAGVPTSFGAAPPVAPSDAFKRTPAKGPSKRSFLMPPQTDIKFGTGSGGGFNPAAYLASMGWDGGGLGEKGDGMVKPIEVQLRPERAGIAFGGRREKTKQARDEARRRGEEVSESEDEKAERRRREKKAGRGVGKEARQQDAADLRKAWTKERKPRKPKVEHRTYEEILEAAGGQPEQNVGQIIDARSKDLKEVSSLASALAHHPVPTSDSMRLPELRHNLRLIAESSKNTLDGLAKEGTAILDKRRWLKREQEESTRRSTKARQEIERLEKVLAVVKEIEAIGKKSMADASVGLADFDTAVAAIQSASKHGAQDMGLDEAVVGAIAPCFKRIMVAWHPLEDGEAGQSVHFLTRWRRALNIPAESSSDAEGKSLIDRSAPHRPSTTSSAADEMSPHGSLLYHLWLPKVRSAINNDWKPHHPTAVVALLTAWRPLLPRYIWDNVADQVLLPKLQRAVSDWEPKAAKASLHHIIFPWLPLLGGEDGGRLDEVMGEARRRLRVAIKAWQPGALAEADEALRRELSLWREFFPTHQDFDSLLLTALLPKLSSHLSSTLSINPSAQDLAPLQRVLAFKSLLRSKMLARLLEAEFVPKWLDTLWLWLRQPGVDMGEVAQWYSWWKAYLSEEQGLPIGDDASGGRAEAYKGVKAGLVQGIALISTALEMEEGERGQKLAKPEFKPRRNEGKSAKPTATTKQARPAAASLREEDDDSSSAFRRIVESRLSASDVLCFPLGRAHERTGRPLLKASATATTGVGSGGVTFYLDDDVVWAEERVEGRKEYVPVGVDELIARAKKSDGPAGRTRR